ncbi:MAG: roadblock/LC7 domain-containing protein [Limisphaerales bacterium]
MTLPPRGGIAFAPTPPLPASAPVPFNASRLSAAPRPSHEPGNGQPPAPSASAPPPAKSAADPNPLLVNLTLLAEGWPEAVRHELVQLNLVDAKVALPAEVVERALKQGRVAFTWKTLRSWIKPAPLPVVSAHDSLVLDLPLKIVAPPFLARQKEAGRLQKKVVVDDDIPNLFFGFPRPESANPLAAAPASASPPKQADTNFYTWDDTSDQPRLQEDEAKRGPSPGTKFVAKYATPNEVVSRAAALDGVAGALTALPDGLMVASRLPANLNGDTLAAFLPQIFGKISQCTRELRMGELNNVNFTVGNVPWKIFRVNAIFFAAFGRIGEPLPTAQLAALAAELDHRPK